MLTFLATFAVFVLVIFGMSLGWIIKRKSIQGSCGGISSIGMEKVCDCPEPCDARKKDGAGSSAEFCKSRRNDNSRPHYCGLLAYLAHAFAAAGESTITASACSASAFYNLRRCSRPAR